jgi:hypothetical protein
MIYQSMSGDAAEGTSYCTIVGGVLKANNVSETGNAKMFYTTNTYCYINLAHVLMLYPEGMDTFLLCACNTNERGWGTAGANGSECVLYTVDQDMQGNIIYDTWSFLSVFMTDGSALNGAIICREDNGDRGCDVYLDSTAVWTVTGDSQVRDLYTGGASILDNQGKTVTILGADGTEYVSGDSDYTITVTGTYGEDDLTAYENVPGIGTVADGEYTFDTAVDDYVNLDYTPRDTDGFVFTNAAWNIWNNEEEAEPETAEETEASIAEDDATLAEPEESEEEAPEAIPEAAEEPEESAEPEAVETETEPDSGSSTTAVVVIIVVVILAAAAVVLVIKKKKK